MLNKKKYPELIEFLMYFISGGLSKLLPMLSAYFIAYLLTPVEYGKSVIFISLISVLSSLSNFGVMSLVVRDKNLIGELEYKALVSNSINFILISSLVVFLIYCCFFKTEGPGYFILLFFSTLSFSLFSLFLKVFMISKKVRLYLIFELFKNGVVALAAFSFVYSFSSEGFLSRVYGVSTGYFFVFLFCCFYMREYFSRGSFSEIKKIFYYSLHFLPQMLSNLIKMGADKIIISWFLLPEVLGVYSYAFLVCSSFFVAGSAINNFATPRIMDFYRLSDFFRLRKFRLRIVLLLIFLSLFFYLIVRFFFLFFSPDGYFVASEDVFFLVCSFLFQSIYLLYAKSFLFYNKMLYLGCANFISVFFYVFSFWLFSSLGPYFYIFLYSAILLVFVVLYTLNKERVLNV